MDDFELERWIKDRPFRFLWIMSMIGVVVTMPLAALMNGGCALPFLAVSMIGSTLGGFFAFFEWTMEE